MSLLRLPEPFDFELSTGRFRTFGTDLANRLVDGVLHRAIGGREVRIRAAAGGVDVTPLDDLTRPVVLKLLGAEFELEPFYRWAVERQPVIADLTLKLAGFRPPLQPDPFEALITSITAQQVSLFSAVAIRNRLIGTFGIQVGEAWAFPTRERIALDLHELATLEDDEVRERITALRGLGPWTAEWFLAGHLARPHAWPAGDLALRKAADVLYGVEVRSLGPFLDPFQNLSAHYMLIGSMRP